MSPAKKSSSPSRWCPCRGLLSELTTKSTSLSAAIAFPPAILARKMTLLAESLNTLTLVTCVRCAIGVTGWIGEIGIRARDLRPE